MKVKMKIQPVSPNNWAGFKIEDESPWAFVLTFKTGQDNISKDSPLYSSPPNDLDFVTYDPYGEAVLIEPAEGGKGVVRISAGFWKVKKIT